MALLILKKWLHKCAKDYKVGDEIEEEVQLEVPQEKIDEILKERLERKDRQREEAIEKIKADHKVELEKVKAEAGQGGGEQKGGDENISKADVAAIVAAELAKVTEQGKKDKEDFQRDVLRTQVISESGTRIPQPLLAGFAITEGESKEEATARFKTFLEKAEQELKDGGFNAGPEKMGSTGTGTGTNTGDHDDKVLLGESMKYYSETMSNLDDNEKVGVMKRKIELGLHEVGKGPIV